MDLSERSEFSKLLVNSFPLVDNHPDVAGLFRNSEILSGLGAAMANGFENEGITKVVAPEARGPVLGALVAQFLNAGLVLIRKEGRNHPGADTRIRSEITWTGERESFQGRSFDLAVTDRVLVVDDWITTGNTIRAVKDVLSSTGSNYVGASVIVNKATRSCIEELGVHSLVDFNDLV